MYTGQREKRSRVYNHKKNRMKQQQQQQQHQNNDFCGMINV